ncbi:Flp family type IVb pilin [Vibrio sp. T187]|uniref:Flp family type IVb pilin n=1 Tax=Vibrio TaxID=662 RepID=UPI0010C98FC9|nr:MULTISPECIES: Flp family type IVb pilin [Vibrio]MBW3694699.1 Flp family type IVb pilin [Vibrio sp. T187]
MLNKLFIESKLALENFKNNEQGVTAIEYGLIAAATAVVIGAAMTPVGDQLKIIFNEIIVALGGTAIA